MAREALTKIKIEEYFAEAEKRFGTNNNDWKFKCPSCGYIASVKEYRESGAPNGAIGFSCVGRWKDGDAKKTFTGKGGPCNYAGGGLIGLNPVTVIRPDGEEENYFELAPTTDELIKGD